MEHKRRPHSSYSAASHKSSQNHESNADQLQRQLEVFTFQLEKEKRQSSVLDGRIRITAEDLSKPGLPVRSSTPMPMSSVGITREIKKLEKQLQLETKYLNETQTENENLKGEINVLRRERILYKDMFKRLQNDISFSSVKAGELHEEVGENSFYQEAVQKRAIRIRAQSANIKSKYISRMEELSEAIKEKKNQKKDYEMELEERLKQSANIANDMAVSNAVLKKTENIWKEKCKEKRKALDQYLRRIKTMKSGFFEIRLATGYDSYDDVVTVFIKSEEQQHEMLSNLTNLNSEIEFLEEVCNRLNKEIQSNNENKTGHEQILKDQMLRVQNENKNLQERSKIEYEKSICIESSVLALSTYIKMIHELLVSASLNTRLEKPPNIKDETDIENIQDHLGLLEDLITQLTVCNSFLREEASPALKAVPVHSLPPKEFDIPPVSLLANQFAYLEEKEETTQEEFSTPLKRKDFINKALKIMKEEIDWSSYSPKPVSAEGKNKPKLHV
ncbi:unnamed protein product [Blepharisma stoltei]|uniref:ODAD1 central coiled coil region domain-containing protein n=1 Tax=Blepharisma stoltei TaxID=1481888 RepID=A0AAU9K548_9CILI|nr:unnamed protein product [Blepharisma stoltei]